MLRTCLLLSLLVAVVLSNVADAGIATVWNFNGNLDTTYGPGGLYYMDEDTAANDPPGIPVGNSDYRTGTPPGGHVSTRSLTSFGTTTLGGQPAGTMTFPKATDTWTGYYVDHTYGPTPANGLSQYTMMFDIRVPQSSFTSGGYLSLFQTDAANSGAGDLFIDLRPSTAGKIGISTIGYSATNPIQADTWHRVAWVYDQGMTASPNARVASLYVDGVLVHQSSDTFSGDSRFRPYHSSATGATTVINPMRGFFLATSATVGENSSAQLNSYLFVDRPMTQLEVQALGAPSANGLLDAVSQHPGVSAVQALSPTHYYRLNEATANTSTPSVIDIGGVPITAAHAGNFAAGGAQAGAHGVWLPGFENGNQGVFHNDAGAINLGSQTNFSATTMTVSLWFKVKQPTYGGGGAYADRIFLNNDATHQLGIYAYTTESTGADVGLAISNGVDANHSALLPSSVRNLHDGRWHHVVIVRNGDGTVLDATGTKQRADVALIVDGVDYSSSLINSSTSWGNTGSQAYIGTRDITGPMGNFAGTSDEVAVWLNKQLSVAEAVALYNAARTPANLPHYAATVLDSKPVAYYRLNEPAGITAGETVVNWANQGTTSIDVLGDANAGINESSAAGMVPTFSVIGPRPTDLAGGRALKGLDWDNTAAQFTADGNNGATPDTTINIGANPLLLDSENLTYSALFRTDSNGQYMRMIVTDPNASDDFFLVLHEGRLALVLDANDGAGGAIALRTAATYSDNLWHHVVAVREGDLGSNARLYVDGQQASLSSFSVGTWGLATTAMIGARGDNQFGFVGLMDEVAIWNRALSAAEARGLYDALTVPEPASLAVFGLGALLLPLARRRFRR